MNSSQIKFCTEIAESLVISKIIRDRFYISINLAARLDKEKLKLPKRYVYSYSYDFIVPLLLLFDADVENHQISASISPNGTMKPDDDKSRSCVISKHIGLIRYLPKATDSSKRKAAAFYAWLNIYHPHIAMELHKSYRGPEFDLNDFPEFQYLKDIRHQRHSINNELPERHEPKHPGEIFDPDELVFDFISADSARLMLLFRQFYPKVVRHGPLRIGPVIDARSRLYKQHNITVDENGLLSATSYPYSANIGRLQALEAILACHMQNFLLPPDELETVYDLIDLGLNSNNSNVLELTLINLVTSTKCSASTKLLFLASKQYFLQRGRSRDIIEKVCKIITEDQSFLRLKNIALTYFLNCKSIGTRLDDAEMIENANFGIELLNTDRDPSLKLFSNAFEKHIQHNRYITPPQMTELLARADFAEQEAGIDFELIYASALSYIEYYLINVENAPAAFRDVVLDKWLSYVADFELHKKVLQRGNIYYGDLLRSFPSNVANFASKGIFEVINDTKMDQRSRSLNVDALTSLK